MCCSSSCFLVLLSTHYGSLQCFSTLFRKLKEIGVLRPLFSDYVTSCDYVQSHKKVCENKDFCNVIMPSEETKKIELNQYQKSEKAPYIIYADLECIIENIDGCKNNLENSSTTKLSKHIPSVFSMFTISPFRSIENKHDVHRGKDSMKKFCGFLREHYQ